VPEVHFLRSSTDELRRPSPIFLGLVALAATGGWITWTGNGDARVGVFTFVAAGWLVSLCLHEYAHARTAFHSGDHGVVQKGYLTLNPLKYSDVGLSIILPAIFVLLGGIGLPGGAVWIDRGQIQGRLRHSLISAAGPLTNVAFAAVLLLPIALRDVGFGSHLAFWSALAYLGFLQVTASLLNLLPIPGLDGFGVVEPWLPRAWVQQANQYSGIGILILFGILWIPPANRAFFDAIFKVIDAVGVPSVLVAFGDQLFRFWT
jgi:Zn-dependent protease